ncbi:MAG: hypothetical protein B6U94_00740 [Thermofilum sp. ex4484_79]|nr:MAG: hypothetical protein B6U94_00740 [Thermofilum sp. ex4484_79]
MQNQIAIDYQKVTYLRSKMWWPSFISPREGQYRVAEALTVLLKSGSTILLNAPTGWGKTLVTLIALKNSNRLPVLWLVRSLSIGDRVMEDSQKLGLRTFIAAGREKTCPLYEKMKEDVHDYCKLFRHRCKYFLELEHDKLPERAESWRELAELGFCSYYAQDYYISNVEIIVQNYYRKRIITKATVIDEFHNLLVPRETRVKMDDLQDAIMELKRMGMETRNIEKILKADNETLPLLVEEIDKIEVYKKYILKLEEKKKTKIGKLLRLLRADAIYRENDVFIGVYASKIRLYPCTVLLSGTVPFNVKNILDIDAIIKVPVKRHKAYILEWVTSRYTEFKNHIIEYDKLLTVIKTFGKRILVFGPDRIIRIFKNKGLYEKELTSIPKEWNMLLLKARGRFSEGVDLEADIVVILGAPYLTPDIIARLVKSYKRLGYKSPEKLATDIPMLTTTLQCIGRAARTPDSNPLIILADYRFNRFQEALKDYLDLNSVESLAQLKNILRKHREHSERRNSTSTPT